MELNRDFREFFASLERHSVRYLLVGGYAMAVHGYPRFTKDLDVWVWMDPANSKAVIAALAEFGFGSLGLTEDDFLTADTVIQLGYPPQRIDLLTTPSGVTFEECWDDRSTIDVDGLAIPVLGIRGLIANKTAAGRDQDLVDVKVLRRMLQSDD
jgi:predicted nucleotidyltransferase